MSISIITINATFLSNTDRIYRFIKIETKITVILSFIRYLLSFKVVSFCVRGRSATEYINAVCLKDRRALRDQDRYLSIEVKCYRSRKIKKKNFEPCTLNNFQFFSFFFFICFQFTLTNTFIFHVSKGTRPPETTSGIVVSHGSTWWTGPRGRECTVKRATGKKPGSDQSGYVCPLPRSLRLPISCFALLPANCQLSYLYPATKSVHGVRKGSGHISTCNQEKKSNNN